MKLSFSTVMSVLLCAALVLCAVGIGAVRGWSDERSAVLASLEKGGDFYSACENRAMDAANLCVVANRHLPAEDPDLVSLRNASQALLEGPADVHAALALDQQITSAAASLGQRLSQLPSVLTSQRDMVYTDVLTKALADSSSLSTTWNRLAGDFNSRLSSDLIGKLARALGVTPLPLGGVDAVTSPIH